MSICLFFQPNVFVLGIISLARARECMIINFFRSSLSPSILYFAVAHVQLNYSPYFHYRYGQVSPLTSRADNDNVDEHSKCFGSGRQRHK